MRRQDAKAPRRKKEPIAIVQQFSPWRLGVLAAHFLRWIIAPTLLLSIWTPARISAAVQLKEYDTPYYIIYTDLDEDSEKEAAIRMTKMAEEYHDRTKDFAGVIREKLPFYLYRSPQDYYDAGGLPGSAGVFVIDQDHGKLMAIAGQKATLNTWHTVQHEGFHQFAHAVIGGNLPPWLNEGLAEYFGEGLFTGDGFVMGIVPPWRLKRLKDSITKNTLHPLPRIMLMSPQDWRARLSIADYDQAWSMVHFLVHGENGKYQQAFSACIREISQGQPFEKAWLDTLGPADGFEARWKAYWLAQPENPSAVLYSRATVSILTSFLARAMIQKQTFDSFDQFASIAESGGLKISPEYWLPPSLLRRGLQGTQNGEKWNLHGQTLSATMPDGMRLTGSFRVQEGKVEVTVRENKEKR
jgi:hypothetical protein